MIVGARLVSASSDATILAQVVMNFLEFNSTVAESMRSSRIETRAQSYALLLENGIIIAIIVFNCSNE